MEALDAAQLLRSLGINESNVMPPRKFNRLVLKAGFNIDKIIDEGGGPNAEALQDAFFATEQTAQTTLSGDLERILAVSDELTAATVKLSASTIADIGGATGATVFPAAVARPDHKFVIIDRSSNALRVGNLWAEKLGLRNVLFTRYDFGLPDACAQLPVGCQLSLLSYVLETRVEYGDEEESVKQMLPALRTAELITQMGGELRIRFGKRSKTGAAALARASHRCGFGLTWVTTSRQGTTCAFRRGIRLESSEMTAADKMIRECEAAFRAFESSE